MPWLLMAWPLRHQTINRHGIDLDPAKYFVFTALLTMLYILQTTFSNAFSWKKYVYFDKRFTEGRHLGNWFYSVQVSLYAQDNISFEQAG